MSDSAKDTLFHVNRIDRDFVFTDRVVEVFDDMVDRSVPFYQEVIKANAQLLAAHLNSGDLVVDLGCATGTTLLQLTGLLKNLQLRFLGLDNSPAMLDKARLKAELFSKQKLISFTLGDITKVNQPETGAFLLNYTLQFIRPPQRLAFVRRLHTNLRPGGVLMLSEKTIVNHSALNRHYIDIYHAFKRERGYSELEIANKREALENVLIPFSIEENKALLKEAGFSCVEVFFQWFNFSSLIAIKDDSP
ncbi:MAG: carboxy-S-adenosyl-L-methionine synthase CmoA [Desulfobulbaceae bacterium]|uniref:Carboxy-S-adenosyl-L-methionine synthase n=1 Tax=Candidatus Desulfatifera sulfidica TaxID=2841691 RepID=A0A8J6N8G3_9BACT|nr:carboxy-S-adenosyl-L-methionine synthase CmoA [Candidatus Desulfatifera sulfidica]